MLVKLLPLVITGEEEGAEPKPAIYIDTTKGRKSYSGEVIMLDDITYLYNDTAEYKSEAMGD